MTQYEKISPNGSAGTESFAADRSATQIDWTAINTQGASD